MATAVCSRCQLDKPLEDFATTRAGRRQNGCKDCLRRERRWAAGHRREPGEENITSDVHLVERFRGHRREYSNDQVRVFSSSWILIS